MNENLEEIEITNNQKWFSKLSLLTSLITLGLLGYLFTSLPKTIKASDGIPEPPFIVILATQIFCILGIVLMILSFSKKEPSTWYKWIGGILNIVLFVIIVGSVIFARTF